MINYNPKVWFSAIFHNYSRQVMRMLRPSLIFLLLFSTLIVWLFLDVLKLHEKEFSSTISIHQLLGIVLGLFLVFRTNSAYDRWWEGRKLWGSMVNNTRNLAFKMNSVLDSGDREEREWFSRMIGNVPASLKDHLRRRSAHKDLELDQPEVAKAETSGHVPNLVSGWLYDRVVALNRAGKITPEHLLMVDRELKEFSDIIGACERIKNTPIPFSYSMFIKKFIFIYLITLPFALVTTLGYITVPVVVLVAFILMSIELIAEEIEEPFGRDSNDLPTDEITSKIRENIREILFR
ncbi:MAG: bestrophin family protein, partial [Bacteroidota bacterium]